MKILKELDPFLALLTSLVLLTAYIYQTFATKQYVDQKHEEVKNLTVQMVDAHRTSLNEIKESLRNIDLRTWEMQKELGDRRRGK